MMNFHRPLLVPQADPPVAELETQSALRKEKKIFHFFNYKNIS